MIYRFSLAILFSLFGHVCAFDEDVYGSAVQKLGDIKAQNLERLDFSDPTIEDIGADGLIEYDENDLSYEEGLCEDDGIKMNYEMPPLNRQYKGTFDQYYKEFEM